MRNKEHIAAEYQSLQNPYKDVIISLLQKKEQSGDVSSEISIPNDSPPPPTPLRTIKNIMEPLLLSAS